MKIYLGKPVYLPSLGSRLEDFYLQKKYGTVLISTNKYTKTDSAISFVCSGIDRTINKINTFIPKLKIVRINTWDTWSVDQTLADIILPLLKQLKETKHGSPSVDDDDVPEPLRSTSAPPKENDWDVDAFHHDRWDWVMNEMIWAFETITTDDYESQFYDFSEVEDNLPVPQLMGTIKIDEAGRQEFLSRRANALRLFGKYYMCLWD